MAGKRTHLVAIRDRNNDVVRAAVLDGDNVRDLSDHADSWYGEQNTKRAVVEISRPVTYVSSKCFAFFRRKRNRADHGSAAGKNHKGRRVRSPWTDPR